MKIKLLIASVALSISSTAFACGVNDCQNGLSADISFFAYGNGISDYWVDETSKSSDNVAFAVLKTTTTTYKLRCEYLVGCSAYSVENTSNVKPNEVGKL